MDDYARMTYTLPFLSDFFKKNQVKNTGQPDPNRPDPKPNWPEPIFNLLKMTHLHLTILYSSLGKLPVFCPSISWTFGLSNSFKDFEYFFCIHLFFFLVHWLGEYIRFYLIHWLDKYTLGSFSFALSLLRKAYRHNIPASREFTRLRP